MIISRNQYDFYTSTDKALKEIDKGWQDYEGAIVYGSHSIIDMDRKLEIIKTARKDKLPFLGICFGLQLAVIEYARNILFLDRANSQEIDQETKYPVVIKMPEIRVGIYKVNGRDESHWHNYKFNNEYLDLFKLDWNIVFSEDNIVEEMRLKNHPFFVLTQYHPEYQSTAFRPHPLLKEFLRICKQQTT